MFMIWEFVYFRSFTWHPSGHDCLTHQVFSAILQGEIPAAVPVAQARSSGARPRGPGDGAGTQSAPERGGVVTDTRQQEECIRVWVAALPGQGSGCCTEGLYDLFLYKSNYRIPPFKRPRGVTFCKKICKGIVNNAFWVTTKNKRYFSQ